MAKAKKSGGKKRDGRKTHKTKSDARAAAKRAGKPPSAIYQVKKPSGWRVRK